MNIFFASTITSELPEVNTSKTIHETLTTLGQKVPTRFEVDLSTISLILNGHKTDFQLDDITARIKKADAFFAKVSRPTTVLGYLIGIALQQGKPVILFIPTTSKQTFFKALDKANEKFQIVQYVETDLEQLKRDVALAVEYIDSSQDTRFNFFVSSDISTYLNWISKNRRLPRSVYLRELIDNDMKRNGNP